MHRCNQLGGRGFNIYKNVKQINPGKGDRGSSKTLRERGVNKLLSHLISTALLNSLPPFVFFSDWNYSGVYIKFVIHILPPPLIDLNFYEKMFSLFFVYCRVNWGKVYIFFTNWGKNMGGSNRKICTPGKFLDYYFCCTFLCRLPFPQ